MDIVIVSRHPAAIQFIVKRLSPICPLCSEPEWESPDCSGFHRKPKIIDSAKAEDVKGKIVAGNLPLHLAAEARFVIAVEFDGPPPRGTEYSLADMEAAGAHLAAYAVERVNFFSFLPIGAPNRYYKEKT